MNSHAKSNEYIDLDPFTKRATKCRQQSSSRNSSSEDIFETTSVENYFKIENLKPAVNAPPRIPSSHRSKDASLVLFFIGQKNKQQTQDSDLENPNERRNRLVKGFLSSFLLKFAISTFLPLLILITIICMYGSGSYSSSFSQFFTLY
jgi:hypothetical protein